MPVCGRSPLRGLLPPVGARLSPLEPPAHMGHGFVPEQLVGGLPRGRVAYWQSPMRCPELGEGLPESPRVREATRQERCALDQRAPESPCYPTAAVWWRNLPEQKNRRFERGLTKPMTTNLPRVGSAVVVCRDDRLLLARRAKCSGSEVRRRICGSGCLGGGLIELVGEAVEVGAGELPLEWGGDLLVAASERE